MTRAAHPKTAVKLAHQLRAEGMSYGQIAKRIASELGVRVAESTVRDWVTYYARIAA